MFRVILIFRKEKLVFLDAHSPLAPEVSLETSQPPLLQHSAASTGSWMTLPKPGQPQGCGPVLLTSCSSNRNESFRRHLSCAYCEIEHRSIKTPGVQKHDTVHKRPHLLPSRRRASQPQLPTLPWEAHQEDWALSLAWLACLLCTACSSR